MDSENLDFIPVVKTLMAQIDKNSGNGSSKEEAKNFQGRTGL
jgi:hypothetical protein